MRSPELYKAVAAGLIDEGAKVTGIGLASTPLLHYTQMDEGLEAAVMVTASHNPKEYHGFKVFDHTGGSLSYDKGLKEVEALVLGHQRSAPVPSHPFMEIDGLEQYVDFIAGWGRRRS